MTPSELKVITWNIRFGVGRLPWFGDSCGDNVIVQKQTVIDTLQKIADFIECAVENSGDAISLEIPF